jgi:hypothetical protein
LSDVRRPVPGGWNRIHVTVEDLTSEVERRIKPAWRFAAISRRNMAGRKSCWTISKTAPLNCLSAGYVLNSEQGYGLVIDGAS